MMQARRSPAINRQQQVKAKAALRMRMLEHEDVLKEQQNAEQAAQDSKPAAVTAALVTFMMAMLSCPLGPCLPATHIHLSRLPIGTGHSEVIDALRREWPRHEFSIKLHVYQKTRHVSGVASVTPGLIPEEMESLRSRSDNMFLPLVSGDKMIVEESKRDSDPHLYARYRSIVLQGLGHDVEGAPPLTETVQETIESPIVYLRVMADRALSNGMLMHVSDIRLEGLVALLDRFPTAGQSLSESVRLIAPDKSANRQHMHRSHFGRAYFLECTDNDSAERLMREIQADSVQSINGMSFSLHVEKKKAALNEAGEPGRLFEQDAHKRQQVERRLEKSKRNIDALQHEICTCGLPERHNVAVHSLFMFKGRHGPQAVDNTSFGESSCKDAVSQLPSTYESTCCESAMDTMEVASVVGTEFTEASEFESYQPYDMGYGFPSHFTGTRLCRQTLQTQEECISSAEEPKQPFGEGFSEQEQQQQQAPVAAQEWVADVHEEMYVPETYKEAKEQEALREAKEQQLQMLQMEDQEHAQAVWEAESWQAPWQPERRHPKAWHGRQAQRGGGWNEHRSGAWNGAWSNNGWNGWQGDARPNPRFGRRGANDRRRFY
eukprot:TRINITY_DN1431_c0_g2_i1.p1 TRINITY_DN1431_c0_g2~~TRINITY_DN1431_c0_g2_i1.p1  ORF type:complete len:711 (+),score=279.71 TRINITY_DN1431_c0_g2_i1:320-2134(+)